MKGKWNWLDWTAMVLLVIGGLNWGLVGLFEYDLVAEIFGTLSTAARVIYTLVGIAAIYIAIVVPVKAGATAASPGQPTATPSR